MKRLSNATLADITCDVIKPEYDRATVEPGIVHLGIGAFHRAHQACYTEAVLNQFGGNWGIIGASLRSPTVKQQLAEQDCLYTIVERCPNGERYQVIGAVKSVLVGPDDPAELVRLMSSGDIKIVSLTVTEKGYCHDPATGNLNLDHPDIKHDLDNLQSPKSAVGYIVAALNNRKGTGTPPFTPLSCDNLPHNGRVLKYVVTQFAEKYDADLARWIKAHVTFPSTMIDRIVPATTEEDRAALAEQLGLRDEGMVVAEPFSQWVIEDNFCSDRPQWDRVGALLTNDVQLFEKIKLRLLNGSHSTLAYCGYLSGFETVSDVMREPAFVKLCKTYMDREAGETLSVPSDFDINDYKKQLRERFANPGLRHRTWQIAMDGSQKLPQRLLETLREQLAGNGNIDIICIAVAAWIRYVSGVDEKGEPIDVQDPYAQKLKAVCNAHKGDPAAMVRNIVAVGEIFGNDLADQPRFIDGVTNWLSSFYSKGVLKSIQEKFA